MAILLKDLVKISIFLSVWLYLMNTTQGPYKEVLNNVPLHLIVTLGYYAIVQISLNIINISMIQQLI